MVAVVFTYPDGTAIVWDPHNQHGFRDVMELWVYAGTAATQAHYDTDNCRSPETGTL